MHRVKTSVRNLIPGDILTGSGQEVLSIAGGGPIPSTEREVHVRTRSGATAFKRWKANTTMTVERAVTR